MDRTSALGPTRTSLSFLVIASLCALAACVDDAPRETDEAEQPLVVECLDTVDEAPAGAWLCGEERVVECNSHQGAHVEIIHAHLAMLDVAATCDELELEPSSPGPFLPGEHELAVSAVDDGMLCASRLVVVDTTPPEVDPGYLELWPPNHKLHWLSPDDCATNAADTCDPDVTVELTWATSDEFADATGDGDTEQDIVDLGCDGVGLRAERDGGRDGRVYTVGYRVTDAAGNATDGACTVVVRHDQGDLEPVQANVEAYRVELGGCQ